MNQRRSYARVGASKPGMLGERGVNWGGFELGRFKVVERLA